MALSRVKNWVEEELTFADLNTEFSNILNNAISLISPLTGALDVDGQTITWDAAAVTTVVSSAAVSWNFTSGAKTGTPATTGSIANWSAQTFTDNNTAGSGTAAAWTGFAIQRPTLAATNALVTTTDAATVYIPNSPAAGTNQTITNAWALWVDAGNVRFDGIIDARGGQIAFPASQSASSGANTLDDYEEGTWTPSLGGDTTYNTQTGLYTKTGRYVAIQGDINVNVLGTGSAITFSGLPFAANASAAEGACAIGYFASLATSVTALFLQIPASGSSGTFGYLTAAAASMTQTTIFGNSARVDFAGGYTV